MGVREKDPLAQLRLPPGFRFYPTDEELLVQYLCRKVAGHQFSLPIIAEVDLYKFNPWDLPDKALFGEKEWYFFSPRDRKYPNGSRPNRVAGSGYWKATGTDKVITTQGRRVGIKKALVCYVGKAPKGTKTNWIMHEYRLTETTRKIGSSKLDDWVLCRIYKKNSSGSKPETSKDHSTGGSCSSSSSHLDDVLESLPEIEDRSFALPRMISLKNGAQLQAKAQENYTNNNNNNNTRDMLQQFGSGSIDWSVLAGLTSSAAGLGGLTQPNNNNHQTNTTSYDMYVPSLPPFHVDENKFAGLDEEVQSGIRTQRLANSHSASYVNQNSTLFGQSYCDSVDPFGIGYRNQTFGFGFGSRQ